jgi:hypothetical protein
MPPTCPLTSYDVRRRVADCLPKALLLAVLRLGVVISFFLLVTPVGLYNAPAALC